jgi:hypothetical protein
VVEQRPPSKGLKYFGQRGIHAFALPRS